MKALLKSSGSLSDVNGWTWPRNDSFKMMTRNTCIDRIWRQNTMQIYWNEKYGFYSFKWRNVHFSRHEMINMTYSFRVYPLKLIFFFLVILLTFVQLCQLRTCDMVQFWLFPKRSIMEAGNCYAKVIDSVSFKLRKHT